MGRLLLPVLPETPVAQKDTYTHTRWTHKVTQPHREPQTTILHSSTQPQPQELRGIHNKAVPDTWGHMPQKNHTGLVSQTHPNTHHHKQPYDLREGPIMTQANKHMVRQPHTTADTHTGECGQSHPARDPHPQPPTLPAQSWATHRDRQSQGFMFRPHTCTVAHTSPDQGL